MEIARTFTSNGDSPVGPAEVYRYERKYVVPEHVAAEVRSFLRPLLSPDEHMPPDSPLGYQVHSLYLDTPQYDLCRQTVEGVRQRYKLRIRFYDESPDGIALLEIKSRAADTVHKQRAAMSKAAAAALLRGERLCAGDLISPSPRSIRALGQFTDRRDRLQAEGTVFCCYWREAYVARPPYDVRVTIDRELTARDGRCALSLAMPPLEVLATPGKIVLELKHGGRPPDWLHDLVSIFQLQRTSFPKYVHCVDALQLAPPWYSGSCGGRYVGMA